ncbi:hypothetical protein [Streptomyces blattellae]|uniref:hypothetical protein n=1 Tax=Streptomyces blattellae TaxID=2569855 RepID=UPI0012B7D82A|nr:hypothetical protein [Streptomyces blattellae]
MTDTAPTNGTEHADDYAAEIRALVDAAPPLSVRQRERLRLVFRARPAPSGADTGTARGRRPGSGSAAA